MMKEDKDYMYINFPFDFGDILEKNINFIGDHEGN